MPPRKGERGDWRSDRRRHAANRRYARQPHRTEPDSGKNQPNDPVERKRYAKHGRNTLAALEFEPHRITMPQKRRQPADQREFGRDHPGDAHRRRTLGHIKQQRRRRQPLAPSAQHISRANITRANSAQIPRAKQPRQDKPKRN